MYDQTPQQRAASLESLVRQHDDQADRDRRLPSQVAEAFARNGLYRIGALKAFGGEEADPVTQIETIETISRFSGSAGWNLMIGIEIFGLTAPGCVDCQDLIADPMVVMCGSTAAVGRAEKDGDGYRVSGKWQFVSGCHNASVFCATVRVYDGEEVISNFAQAVVPAPDFKIVEAWQVGGMRGSGSHDIELDGVWIPANQIIKPIATIKNDQPLMQFPSGARLSYNKVAVSLGIARAGLDAFVAIAEGKVPRFTSKSLRERNIAQRAIAEAEVRVRASRALLMEQVGKMWQTVCAGNEVSLKERALFQITCSDAVKGCVEAIDQIADAAGTSANFLDNPLERISRDVRVVRQHLTVASMHIEDGGRVLLGLDPKGQMLLL